MLDADVLDGFAGTGALGIEALSRGAADVTFVEPSRQGADLIAKNLAHCGVGAGYTMVHATMHEATDRCSVDASTCAAGSAVRPRERR